MTQQDKYNELFKIDLLGWDNITRVTDLGEDRIKNWDTFEKLMEIYEDVEISYTELLQANILLYEIESLISCDGMRDPRLSNLNSSEVKKLAFELYLKVGITRAKQDEFGYTKMHKCANGVIKKHLEGK